MNTIVNQLLQLMESGQSPMSWVMQNRSLLSLPLARAARQRFGEALRAGDLNSAVLAAQLSAILHSAIGNKYDGLIDQLSVAHILYMSAETEQSYIASRQTATSVAEMAAQIGARDIQFNASVLAADNAFFIMKKNRHEHAEAWALNALDDVAKATQFIQDRKNPEWFQQFVSLIMALNNSLDEEPSQQVSGPISNRADVKEMLRQIAVRLEAQIPVDFEYPEDENVTINFNYYLIKLSFKYGSKINGHARSEKLLELAERTDQQALWHFIQYIRYVLIRARDGYGNELIELRRNMCIRIESYRRHYRSRAGRILVAQQLQRPFGEFLRDVFIDPMSNQEELFELIESTKARTLLDQMAAGRISFQTTAVQEYVQTEERRVLRYGTDISKDLHRFELQLLTQLPLVRIEGEERDPLLALEDFYRTHQGGLENTQAPVPLSDVMKSLQPDEAIIEFCIPYHESHPAHQVWIMVISNSKVELIPTQANEIDSGFVARMNIMMEGQAYSNIDVGGLLDLVWAARVQIQEQDDATARRNLYSLYQLLIVPLLAHGWEPRNFKHWIIIPHGPLHFIPWGALLNESSQFLIETVAVTVAPSASVWLRLLAPRPPITSFLGLANPDVTYLDIPPLPEALKEISSIQARLSQLQTDVFIKTEASKANLKKFAEGRGIIHIAAHGYFPVQDFADAHQILLAGENERDGRLYAEELRQIEFTDTQFVALSICDGGIYRFGPGDEPYGLISALLSAGVQNILGTLWDIDSRTTTYFMLEFYRHLLDYGPAGALQRTCLQFIRDEALLSQWAGFVLVGPGRKLSVEIPNLESAK